MCSKNEKIKLNNLGIFHSAQLDVGPLSFWWQKKYKEIQNNQKLNNKQEWLIEINHAKDELENYDSQQLKKFLSNQKSSPKTSDVRSVKQIRNKTKNFKKNYKFSDYQKIQDEMLKKTLKNNPSYCTYCGCTGKDVWSDNWVKVNGIYDFSKFKKDCPICLGKSALNNKNRKFLPKLSQKIF